MFSVLAARSVAALGSPITGDVTTSAEEPEVTSFCAQVAEVEVDSETGQIKVRRFVTSHDVGTIFNPLGHQGQIDGAVIQGLGYALMEELQSEDGLISTLSLGDVKIPAIADVPELVTVLVESADGNGPYPGKAIGENPISPVAPAIANAIFDAVGVRIDQVPVGPHMILKALEEKARGREPRYGPQGFPDYDFGVPLRIPTVEEGGDGRAVNAAEARARGASVTRPARDRKRKR